MRFRNASASRSLRAERLGVNDVTREIGENDSPGEGVLPHAGAKADMLSLLGDPDAQKLEGGGVTI